jgi:SAM-dependent methyltransferase
MRTWASGATFALLAIFAVAAQVHEGIPIDAEVGPVETAEVGFMALLAVMSLRVLFVSDDIGPARPWLITAAVCFAASGVNDIVGFTQPFPWVEPFDDISAVMSWAGALVFLGAAVQLRSLPMIVSVLVAVGFVLHISTLLMDFAAAFPVDTAATGTGVLAKIAELTELSVYATYATGLSVLAWTIVSAPPVVDQADAIWPWPLQYVDACDLCGSSSLSEVVPATTISCRTVLCECCGLLFASPMIHPGSLNRFFADGFDGDPGTRIRVERDDMLGRKAFREDQFAREWAVPLIERHMHLRGKRILDIRSRTGALARAMMERGAEVAGLDPLEPNVDYAREVNGLENIRFSPISELADLRGIPGSSVDAVTVLTVHILGHLPSPRRHLERIFDVLRPGGFVFIDEKHALRPARTTKSLLFGSTPVHTFHFTEETIARYIRSAGFDLVECSIDRSRTTAFRHLQIVARKPVGGGRVSWHPDQLTSVERAKIQAEIADAQHRLDRIRSLNAARRQVKRLLRRLGA